MKRTFKPRPASAFAQTHSQVMEQVDVPFLGDGKFRHTFEASIDQVIPDPNQPRRNFEQASLEELAVSLKQQGQLQPILVRQSPENSEKWIIVAGERRFRAAKLADWTSILAIPHDGNSTSAALIENLMRVDLNPVEEAKGIKNLLDYNQWSQRKAAAELGMDQARISRAIKLLSLPESFLEKAGAASIPMNVLVGIARIDDQARREKLMEKALSGEVTVASLNERNFSIEPDRKDGQSNPDRQLKAITIEKMAPKIIKVIRDFEVKNVKFSEEDMSALRLLHAELTKLVG
ncbi:ParB/RepB/Spo0J family partition protein [Neokomagataea thailandica]|uniref:Chromosome partitioning protein ParB n=1 Tax=Neokomagataea tanensis NBRC 106556 TaxID=1223519 RepID=A0ABQ0QKQ6_9PROT|nr:MULTISPECIES: ParB/RepB/Spo0J family partition protein [Neokomagataea]GBR48296.1 chromosome partitioning protein ParB [Neokomagataea tanensis NBRC 106556]